MNIRFEEYKGHMNGYKALIDIIVCSKKVGHIYKFKMRNPWTVCFDSRYIGKPIIPGEICKATLKSEHFDFDGFQVWRFGSEDPWKLQKQLCDIGIDVDMYKANVYKIAYENGLIPEFINGSISCEVSTDLKETKMIATKIIENDYFMEVKPA